MKHFTRVILLPILFLFSHCNSQSSADPNLMEKIRESLNNGEKISAILKNPAYQSLHPDTEFRELVRAHADTTVLQITTDTEPGKKIKTIVKVRDEQGRALPNVLVYLYQTDARGWYSAGSPHVGGNDGDMGHARLFGYVRTNSAGQFELHTVKPSGYPQSDLPAHIHIHFSAPGYKSYVTELLFDDDERLVGNIRAQSIRYQFLVAKPEKAEPPLEQLFSYEVMLKKG